jgi:hypothetical protein
MAVGQNPGGLNTIIPLHDQSGHLQISFGRDPKSYALNQYTAQINCPGPMGSYLKFDPKDAHRSPNDAKWPLGTPRPKRPHSLQNFSVYNFVAERYSYEAILDNVSIDVADFDVTKVHTEKLAREAMLNRTVQCLTNVLAESNYSTTHIATATALAGGFLNAGTTSNPILMKTLQEAALIIQKDTGGIGGRGRAISILMSNTMAVQLSRSREIREYVSNMVGAQDMVTGDGWYEQYGIPKKLFGFPVVIEDAYVNVGIKENATSDVNTTVSSVLNNAIFLFVREGDLSKGYMDAGFSSWTQFVYNDFATKAKIDDYDGLTYLSVEDFYDIKVTAPETVFKINNVLS